MISTQVLLLQLLCLSLASASHYGGGVVSFKAKSFDNGTYEVKIRNRATFRGCGYQHGPCTHGNCGQITRLRRGVIDTNTEGLTYGSWCQTESVVTRTLTINTPFKTREFSCCWVSLITSFYDPWWSVQTKFDLGIRSDTNGPNNSPATAIVSLLRVPQNCPRTYSPLLPDKDGDVVRCRYGNKNAGECGDCRRQNGFHVNEAACTLEYLGYGTQGLHGFELVVEDFARQYVVLRYADGSMSVRQTTTTTSTAAPQSTRAVTSPTTPFSDPFSILPFQFLFRVDPAAPSCTVGEYIPQLVYPTPQHGAVIAAEAGREVEIRIKATAQFSRAHNIVISGPLNITKHTNTQGYFTIRWTPTLEDLGHLFPIAFVVEYKTGHVVYQSEMRSVLVNVTSGLVHTVVTCTEDSMIVEVEKDTLPPVRFDHLRLLSEASNTICSLQTYSNDTHVVAKVPLNRCGTQIEEDGDNLNFKNEITTEDDLSTVITRRHQVEIKFYCCYAKQGNVTASFSAHRGLTEVFDKGFGKFTYAFEFYSTTTYSKMMDPSMYPLEYDVGERIYSQIEATTTVNNTELFVQSCRASPFDTENSSPTYTLIEDGCTEDPTIQIHQRDHPREFRFSFEAFKFLDHRLQDHDQVFISCMVLMCEAGNPNTRCSRGCQRNGAQRWKREAVIETGTHYVSQGPLRRKRSAEAAGSSGLNLSLNLVFISGCVLAVVGMICGVIIYKVKKSTVKYQLLPTEEN